MKQHLVKLSLNDIVAYSECPAFYHFTKQVEFSPTNVQLSMVQQVIKNAYTVATQTGFRCSWRRLVTQVDGLVFAQVDISNPGQYQYAKNLSEYILVSINKWYHDVYLKEDLFGYIDVPVRYQVGSSIIEDFLPVIVIADTPILIYFSNVETTEVKLYNNLKVRGLQWLMWRNLDCDNITARYVFVGEHGGLNTTEVTIAADGHLRIEKVITSVAKLIESKVSYPSRTERCDNCSFNRRCRL